MLSENTNEQAQTQTKNTTIKQHKTQHTHSNKLNTEPHKQTKHKHNNLTNKTTTTQAQANYKTSTENIYNVYIIPRGTLHQEPFLNQDSFTKSLSIKEQLYINYHHIINNNICLHTEPIQSGHL